MVFVCFYASEKSLLYLTYVPYINLSLYHPDNAISKISSNSLYEIEILFFFFWLSNICNCLIDQNLIVYLLSQKLITRRLTPLYSCLSLLTPILPIRDFFSPVYFLYIDFFDVRTDLNLSKVIFKADLMCQENTNAFLLYLYEFIFKFVSQFLYFLLLYFLL